jgi:hypothetical protein
LQNSWRTFQWSTAIESEGLKKPVQLKTQKRKVTNIMQYTGLATAPAVVASKNEEGLGSKPSTARGSLTIGPGSFDLIADSAMLLAAAVDSTVASDKEPVFAAQIIKLCGESGDSIPNRFIQVCDPSVFGNNVWWWENEGARLSFFKTGSDGFRYVASIYP